MSQLRKYLQKQLAYLMKAGVQEPYASIEIITCKTLLMPFDDFIIKGVLPYRLSRHRLQ